jgi:hypothetical protein
MVRRRANPLAGGPCHRATRLGGVALAMALGGALSAVAADPGSDDFETPRDEAVAALLPPDMAASDNYKVVGPVRSDGLMHHYILESRFGRFDAYGYAELQRREHEVAALAQLAKISKLEVVAAGLGAGLAADLDTVKGIALHPVTTVTGIPTGITHLFEGYLAEGKEAAADANRIREQATAGLHSSADAPKSGGALTKEGTDAARRYAARYLGISGAERRWYKKLGVDPYTDNVVLRQAIHQDALLDATAHLALRLARLPGIPGLGTARRTTDAIYNEDPAVIRARQRASLAGYGLDADEIDRWHNAPALSPSQQTLLFGAAEALQGVAGRGELFRHAASLKSEAEGQVYLRSVGLLVVAHQQRPLASVLPSVRLPAARTVDGRTVVCASFDAVYWTPDVADGERHVRESLSLDAGASPELWLEGHASARARQELERQGWQVRENAGTTSAGGSPGDSPPVR